MPEIINGYDPKSEEATSLGPPFFYDNNTEKLCGAWLYYWMEHYNDGEFAMPDTWGNVNNPSPLLPTLKSYGNIVKNAKNDGGSFNHYILRNAVRLAHAYMTNDKASLQLAIDHIHYWFVSQLHQGHGWFANRDETTSPGYTKLHVAGVNAIKIINYIYNIDNQIDDYATEWNKHQLAIFDLCQFNGHIYLPGKRSKPYGKMLAGNLFEARYNREFDNIYALLKIGVSNEDLHFYQVVNKIGHPANIGSYFVMQALNNGIIDPHDSNGEGNKKINYVTDLPKLGNLLTVKRSKDVFVAYYSHVDITQDNDWMHWKVQKNINEKLATEVAEFGYQKEPRIPLNIPNIAPDKRIIEVTVGKDGAHIYVDNRENN